MHRVALVSACLLSFASASATQCAAAEEPQESEELETFGGSFLERSKLTGDWGGARDELAKRGFTVDLDVIYTLQGLADGGYDGRFVPFFTEEDRIGNTVSTELALDLDTGKVGLWPGGFFDLNAEFRAGRSMVERTGTVTVVNNDAIFPNVEDRFDKPAAALTTLTYSQEIIGGFSLFGGLLNTAEGDENAIAGSALSHEHFLNTGLLYALVEDAAVPNVTLGGGFAYEPSEVFSGSFSVFGTEETAGENPFDHMEGVTFSTEGTFSYQMFERPGAQTVGFLYGIDKERTAIATDRRLLLIHVLAGQPIPTTESDTWSVYYNGHQMVMGDEDTGWGPFWRFGISDGNPNPVHWHIAGGLGGSADIIGRAQDRWGIGVYHLNFSHEDLLQVLRVDDETGGEVFYNVALAPWMHLTFDAQVMDGGLPGSDLAWILGLRTGLSL